MAQEKCVGKEDAAMIKTRALVSEDCSLILLSLEALLEESGVEIVGASATVAGLRELIQTTPADIAILDVNLLDGLVFPAADMLIERGVPIIFTTGYAPDKIFPARFMKTPVLQKPYEPDTLLRMLENALGETRAVRTGLLAKERARLVDKTNATFIAGARH
jgi:DNA-binding NtrC family response regulator